MKATLKLIIMWVIIISLSLNKITGLRSLINCWELRFRLKVITNKFINDRNKNLIINKDIQEIY